MYKFRKITKDDLYEISLKSANAKDKEVYIFEIWNLGNLIGNDNAEKIRKLFLKNEIKVKQITNSPILWEFSKNNEFINKVMSFRYIPKKIFDIEYEILIFDNIVAIYNDKKILIIEDRKYSNIQKKLFMSIWDQWELPVLWFDYKPNHSYYNSLDFYVWKLQVIIWPDVQAKESYKNFDYNDMEKYIKNIIEKDKENYDNISYIIGFIWSYNGDKMIDLWKFNYNYVDDRSWPLWDVIVYKNWEKCDNLGIVSWNTLIILWYEEKLRRQSFDLKNYLEWLPPKLPFEIMNWKDFFNNK